MTKLALFLLLVPGLAYADDPPRVEVGLVLGGHAFADDVELGVADQAMEPGPVSAGLLGVRTALAFHPKLALEAEMSWIPTEDDVLGKDATVWWLGAHARWDFITGRIRPFVVAGVGTHILRSSSPQMDNDADKSLHWGAGARYAITNVLDARLDARHLIVPGRTANGVTNDFEVSAGITYRFGVPRPPLPLPPVRIAPLPTPPAPPPPAPPVVVELPKAAPIPSLAGIGFERDSAVIDLYSAPILERAYDLFERNPTLTVEISGHTSTDGNRDRNYNLSLDRALAVKAYLVRRGIDGNRVLTVGHGPDHPIADNTTEEGRRKNRRIEFRVISPDP